MAQRKLTLVQIPTVGRQGYFLPDAWEDSVRGWLTWLRLRGLSKATIKLRRDHVRSIARRLGVAHPNMVTLTMLVDLSAEHQWSQEHLKAMRSSLNSYFEWCVTNDETAHNPAAGLPRVKAPPPAPRPVTDRIWEELLEEAAPRERLIALLAGEAGLRRAEIALVHIDDVVEDLDGWSLIVHGKGSKQRVVPLTNRLAREIREFHHGTGWIFEGQIDGHISAHYVGALISDLLPPGWSIHKLRHRFATKGYRGTGNLRAVQQALGHASVATTERYTAVSSREVRLVSEAAANVVSFGRSFGGDDVA